MAGPARPQHRPPGRRGRAAEQHAVRAAHAHPARRRDARDRRRRHEGRPRRRPARQHGRPHDERPRAHQRPDAAPDPAPRRGVLVRARRGTRARGLRRRALPLRGVRTGKRRPPRGFTAQRLPRPVARRGAARVPATSDQHRDQGPRRRARGVPRGPPSCSRRCCAAAAARDIIVVSFDQSAIDRFHELAPRMPVSPGIDGVAGFVLGSDAGRPATASSRSRCRSRSGSAARC